MECLVFSGMTDVVVVEKRGNVQWIRFNRPKQRNALNKEMYDIIVGALDDADNDDDITYVVFTGTGEFYSSGNDFSPKSLPQMTKQGISEKFLYQVWVDRLIMHKKILIALVNGPAIGIACTTLSLFDLIVCSDKAYFLTPFTQMGICPEGTSSISFMRSMGYTKAAQMILFSEPLTAQDAFTAGFVARVIPQESFQEETAKLVDKYSKNLVPQSVLFSKKMVRTDAIKNELLDPRADHGEVRPQA
uniref:Enoyl-CoA delta isomerase 2, mitochondrial n=1 Tax=Steinernema glaseri TaxID=37863 RepID=A0A1I7ZAX8_9BILA